MPDPKRDDSRLSMGVINREIAALIHNTDQASRDRVDELFDMLLSSDMACGAARRNMGQRKPPENPGTSEGPTP